MPPRNLADESNGYESVADKFMSGRSQSDVGVTIVRAWAKDLPRGGAVLDLGCGNGRPISQIFIDEGFTVYGVDASASMIAAFRAQVPGAQSECNTLERSNFFDRTFDGITAWGLLFLLAPETQTLLIQRVAKVLNRGGQFLFTSPQQACEWSDTLTGRKSVSLGTETYRSILAAAGLTLIGERQDEGDNHYYLASKEPAKR